MKDITAEIMRTLFDYDHDTGIFWWRVKPSRRVKAGAAAGSVSSDGYIVIGVDGTNFKAHRLAWLHFHGVWPEHEIDHLNGNRADNRIANLRDVSRSTNAQNQTRPRSGSTSSYIGVSWNKRAERWHAKIMANGQRQHLGYFKSAKAAHAAYLAAKLRFHQGDVRNLTGLSS
jgi:hypothetical protein